MSLFAEILCKQLPNTTLPSMNHISIDKLSLSLKYNTLYYTSTQLVYQIYFLPYNNTRLLYKKYNSRFHIFKDIILNNRDISKQEKSYFINKFTTAQNIYNSFRQLSNKIKLKYGKRFGMDMDLCFVNFSELNSKILITLIEDKIIYKYRISDLINIINKALSYAPMFFAEPSEIKNPYTNIPFSLHNLYNIYFTLRKTNYNMPMLFHQYFMSNFNLVKFKNHNECYIREKTIENFIKDASIDDKHYQIQKMFYTHHKSIYFIVHSHFPREKLVKVFNKYIRSYLLEEYSLNPYVRESNKIHLDYSLTLFSQLNPEFGKRIWVKKQRAGDSLGMYYLFNDSVIEQEDLIREPYTTTPRVLSPIHQISGESHLAHDYEDEDESSSSGPARHDEDDEDDNEDDNEDDEAEEIPDDILTSRNLSQYLTYNTGNTNQFVLPSPVSLPPVYIPAVPTSDVPVPDITTQTNPSLTRTSNSTVLLRARPPLIGALNPSTIDYSETIENDESTGETTGETTAETTAETTGEESTQSNIVTYTYDRRSINRLFENFDA